LITHDAAHTAKISVGRSTTHVGHCARRPLTRSDCPLSRRVRSSRRVGATPASTTTTWGSVPLRSGTSANTARSSPFSPRHAPVAFSGSTSSRARREPHGNSRRRADPRLNALDPAPVPRAASHPEKARTIPTARVSASRRFAKPRTSSNPWCAIALRSRSPVISSFAISGTGSSRRDSQTSRVGEADRPTPSIVGTRRNAGRQLARSTRGAECKSAVADGTLRPRAITRDDAAAPATPTHRTRRVADDELIGFDRMCDDSTRTHHRPFADLDRRDNRRVGAYCRTSSQSRYCGTPSDAM
jgi:hypothetical protein